MHWMVTEEDIFAEGKAEGIKMGVLEKIISQTCRKLRKGKSPEVIADELEEDIELVEKICKTALAFAPEFDEEKIAEAFSKEN